MVYWVKAWVSAVAQVHSLGWELSHAMGWPKEKEITYMSVFSDKMAFEQRPE